MPSLAVPSLAVPSLAARGIRPAFAAAVAAGVVVAVAGCSSGGSSSAAAGASTSASASPSASVSASASGSTAEGSTTAGSTAAGALPTTAQTPQPAASGQLTGTQLESILLPLADFPSGYAASRSGPVTSGSSLDLGVGKYSLATMSCPTFVQNLGATGFGETALVSDSVSAAGKAFDEIVYQFSDAAGASAFVSGIESLTRRCGSFSLTSNGVAATFKLSTSTAPAVGGHPATEVTETGKVGSEQVNLDLLLCADGVDTFGVAAVGAGGAAPAVPAKGDIMDSLMKRQSAAALLG